MPITIDHPAITKFDESVDEAFVPLRKSSIANRIFYSASEAANHSILWHVLTWLPVTTGSRSPRDAAKISAALGVESAVVNGPVKMLFRRERPVEHNRPHSLRTPRTSSFPSGHATSGLCAAILLSSGRKHKLPYFIAAAIVASSRVHVRIHHASDVVAGAAIGATVGSCLRSWLLRK